MNINQSLVLRKSVLYAEENSLYQLGCKRVIPTESMKDIAAHILVTARNLMSKSNGLKVKKRWCANDRKGH